MTTEGPPRMLIGVRVPQTAWRIRAVGRPGWVKGRNVGAYKNLVLKHQGKLTAGTWQLGMLNDGQTSRRFQPDIANNIARGHAGISVDTCNAPCMVVVPHQPRALGVRIIVLGLPGVPSGWASWIGN